MSDNQFNMYSVALACLRMQEPRQRFDILVRFWLLVPACLLFIERTAYFVSLKAKDPSAVYGIGLFVILLGVILTFVVIFEYYNARRRLCDGLSALSHDQLKTNIKSNPDLLRYLPDHNEELALIAITADVNMMAHTHHCTTEFLRQVVRVHPKAVIQIQKDGDALDKQMCKLWLVALEQDSTLIADAPRHFVYYEFEIYSMVARNHPEVIDRILTIKMQERVRRAIAN